MASRATRKGPLSTRLVMAKLRKANPELTFITSQTYGGTAVHSRPNNRDGRGGWDWVGHITNARIDSETGLVIIS